MTESAFHLESTETAHILALHSADGTNRLTQARVLALSEVLRDLAGKPKVLIIRGNDRFFSAGADLAEIAGLYGPSAYEFSRMGQELMRQLDGFPAPVYAAISGYCMGGGLDLALACRYRIASPHAVFGHRGAAFGLITGWGGTQRLPRLIGKGRALAMFVGAETVHAELALQIGLVGAIAEDPLTDVVSRIRAWSRTSQPL